MELTDIQKKVQAFYASYEVTVYKAGRMLALPGVSLPGVLYIETGLVEQYHIDKDGNRVVVNAFRTGAFFPMSWAINQTPNEYFFEAVEATHVRAAPPEIVLEFLKNNGDVLLDLLSRVYRGTDVLLKRLALTASASAMTRLAYELAVEAYRLQPDAGGFVHVMTTQSALAARSGLVRETVSRQLKKMEAAGLLSLEDGIRFRPKDIEGVAGL